LTSVANPGTDLTDKDPQLTALGNYGGTTETQGIKTSSPAVNTGVCSDGSGNAIITDQRGYARDANCDMGAYESRAH